MKIRLLLLFFSFLLHAGTFAQIAPTFKHLQKVSVAGAEPKENSRATKKAVASVANTPQAKAELAGIYHQLKNQQPTATMSGAALSGGKLRPGVYRIKGNTRLHESLELLANNDPTAVYVFQVEGNLELAPQAAIALRQGVRAKNVFWQVEGTVSLGTKSVLKGTVVAMGNIVAKDGVAVQGKLFSTTGQVSLSNASVTPLGSENIADLEVRHEVSEGPYRVGLEVTYTITLRNLGPDKDTNVVVNFETPSGIQYLSSTTSMGTSYDPIRREWIIDKFNNRGIATMVVKAVIVKTEFSTTVVTVTGDGTDPNIKNNTSELSVCATPSATGAITGKALLCVNSAGNVFQVGAVSGVRKYAWTFPAGWIVTAGLDSNTITVTTGDREENGTISVRAVNACGEGPETTFQVSTISSPPPMPSSITGPTSICLTQEPLTYAISPVEGAVSYAWEIPAGWSIVRGQGTESITVTAGTVGGKVRVTAQNTCGKSASSEVQVEIAPPAPPAPNQITGPAQVCANAAAVTFQVAAAPIASGYTWTVPAGWSITSGQGTAQIMVRVGTTAGQVTVQARNSCGTSASTSLQIDLISEVPVVEAISGNRLLCASDTEVSYSIDGVANAASYLWSVPADWQILSGQGTTRINVRVGTSGEVKVTASNACGNGTAATVDVAVSNLPPAVPGTITGSAMPCFNQDDLIYSITAVPGAVTYTWVVPAGWAILSGQGTTSIRVKAGTTSGTISVLTQNGCGSSASRTLQVTPTSTVPAAPTAITGETVPCIGREHTYAISNPTAGFTYTWTVPVGWNIVSGQGTASLVVTAGSTAGQITVTASNGCGQSNNTLLPVAPTTGLPALTANIEGEIAVCANTNNLTYRITAPTGTSSFQWQVPADWTIISGQGTAQIQVKAGSSNGTIQVSASNGCGQSTTRSLAVTISSAAPTTPGQITGPAGFCANAGEATYSIEAVSGATTYTWTVPSTWSIIRGQGTTSLVVRVGTEAGAISVTPSNGCGGSTAGRLEVTPLPAAVQPTAILGDASPCGGGTEQTYRVSSPVAGLTYTWAVPTDWIVVSGQGTATLVVKTGNTPGSISVRAGSSCGNSEAQLLAVTPTSLTPATDQIQGTVALCADAVQTYSVAAATGATGYQWQVPSGWTILSGQGTREIQVRAGTSAGEVAVTTQYNCGTGNRRTLAVAAGSNNLALPGAITGATGVCASQTQHTYSIQPVAGATSYDWVVPTGWTITAGQGTTTINVQASLNGGQVTVAARNACQTTATTVLEVGTSTNEPPVLGTISSQGGTCSATRITFQVAPVAGVTTYTWTLPTGWTLESGQGTSSITVLAGSTDGTIRVTGVNGCGLTSAPSTLDVRLQNSSLPRPSPITVAASSLTPCVGQQGLVFRIEEVPGATSYEWTHPADWQLESGQGTTTLTLTAGRTAGQVSVVAKNACGQSEGRSVAVEPSTGAPVISGEISGDPFVCANAGAVTYSISGTSAVDRHTWTVPEGWTLVSGQHTNTISVIPSSTRGTITVLVSNNCGVGTQKSLAVTPSTDNVVRPGLLEGPTTFCATSEQKEFSIAEVTGASTYEWSLPAGWVIVSGQGTNRIRVTVPAGVGTISVKAKNGCSISEPSQLQVTATPAMATSLLIKDESSPCIGNQFSVPAVPGVTYTWRLETSSPGWSISSGQGTNQVKVQAPADAHLFPAKILVEASNGTCSTASASHDITPRYLAPVLNIPNVFSPNNDGRNDVWVVRNLLEFPDNDLVILNRWGSEVYRMKKYANNWNGSGLAEGTYYYVLRVRLCDGQEVTHKGYVTVMR